MRALFDAGRTDEAETAATIRRTLDATGYLLDPHTAVGVNVAERVMRGSTPMVTLATAHPAKFPAAVKAATGHHPALPPWLGDLMSREERMVMLSNDLLAVERHVEARAKRVPVAERV
jgi:threonine synthase